MGEWGREFQHQRDRVPVGETVFTSRLGITGQHAGPWLMLDAQDAAEEHGALSDRTTSRFGRRRPWLIVGSLVCMSTLVCIGIQTTVAGVALGSLALSASFMIIGAGLSPVVPDQVPVAQRGVVLGWAGLGPQVGGLIAGGVLLGLVTGFSAQYMLMAAFPLLILLFATTMKDPPLPRRHREPFSLRAFLDGYRISPRAPRIPLGDELPVHHGPGLRVGRGRHPGPGLRRVPGRRHRSGHRGTPCLGGPRQGHGLANLMTSLPYVRVPLIASVVLGSPGGYHSLFLCSAAMSALGAVLVWKVKTVR
ncbi:MFS transporter [Streptomyces inhibens]|uniref:MFS transporter n=1 Tax=Streptomyces inhibens TaxID=2293571 RepID=UPI00247975FF|nr:MFS transporter [Streptomyces inhibens]